MRKFMMAMTVMALALTVGTMTASAQTTIAFGNGGGSGTGNVTFIANGDGSASLDLGVCSGLTCTLLGPNTGGGTYSFTTTETSPNQIQVSSGFIGSSLSRGISMDGATTMFSYTGAGGTLSGTVIWSSLITDGNATINGVLTITSSTFSGPLGVVGKQAAIDFSTNGYGVELANTIFVTGSTKSYGAALSSGQVVTPEPNSMLLFGTGLLLAGGILRRRLA